MWVIHRRPLCFMGALGRAVEQHLRFGCHEPDTGEAREEARHAAPELSWPV